MAAILCMEFSKHIINVYEIERSFLKEFNNPEILQEKRPAELGKVVEKISEYIPQIFFTQLTILQGSVRITPEKITVLNSLCKKMETERDALLALTEKNKSAPKNTRLPFDPQNAYMMTSGCANTLRSFIWAVNPNQSLEELSCLMEKTKKLVGLME